MGSLAGSMRAWDGGTRTSTDEHGQARTDMDKHGRTWTERWGSMLFRKPLVAPEPLAK